jgi:hypothetical protein
MWIKFTGLKSILSFVKVTKEIRKLENKRVVVYNE